MRPPSLSLALLATTLCVGPTLFLAAAEDPTSTKPVKVFLLAGQSNMVGMASTEHLQLLANETCCNEYRSLWNGTAFAERDHVYMKYNDRQGKLTVGTGFAAPNKFGTELGFGWVVGDTMGNESVVLIKAAYGGRTLAVDFRPPASGEGTYSKVKPVHYGWEYRQMMADLYQGLDQLVDFYPDYDEAVGYELAGFVWFQGWNDMLSWPYVKEYSYNVSCFDACFDACSSEYDTDDMGTKGLREVER